MSTRSVVARKTGDSWKGVYCHWDGYPRAKGEEIFKILNEQYFRNEQCSKYGNDQAKPENAVRAFCDVMIDGHLGGWSAFGTECYCHSPYFVMRDGIDKWEYATPENADPLFIEWLYIIDPATQTMEIHEHYNKLYKPGKVWNIDDPYEYDWRLVTTVDLNGEEPDWVKIEDGER